MCQTYSIAKATIKEFIGKKEPFAFDELQDEILRRNGVLRVAPGVTIGDYLRSLERRNIIFYNQFSKKIDFMEYVEKLEDSPFEKTTYFSF